MAARTRTALLAAVMTAAFMLVLRATPASATTYTVNTLDDTSGNSDCSLRDAINAADGNPTSGSTCTTTGTGNDTIQFSVTGTILLTSTLPQVTDSQLAINGPASPGSITIDGAGSGSCFFCEVQVMHVAVHASVNLNNLTIANGIDGVSGGGIFNEGTLTVTNTTFSHNGTNGAGGAIANSGTLTVVNSIFTDNGVGFQGFACLLGGGAISSLGSLTVTNSTFSGNLCGGGTGEAGEGGAIVHRGQSIAKISNCTFIGNDGTGGGGAIGNEGIMTVTNSTFSSNRVGTRRTGGGIFNGGALTVTNSTFSKNVAGEGGGGIFSNGLVAVTNSTFSDNVTQLGINGFAGAIENEGFATSVKSTIIAGSTDVAGPTANCSGTITDAGYNISDDNSCGFTPTDAAHNGDGVNPLLSATGLANNGGPTQTIALDSESPAIDAIPLADCTDQTGKPITIDQRGFPRPDFGEDVCDIGAFETQESFAGQPGKPNCHGQSVAALSNMYGTLDAAASALGFPSVQALQDAIRAFCGG